MDKTQFERNIKYGVAIAIAKQLLHRKLITLHEYQKLTDAIKQKYQPAVSFPNLLKNDEERRIKCKKS